MKEESNMVEGQSSLAYLMLFPFVNHLTKEMRHFYESYEFEKLNWGVSLSLSLPFFHSNSIDFFFITHILPCAIFFFVHSHSQFLYLFCCCFFLLPLTKRPFSTPSKCLFIQIWHFIFSDFFLGHFVPLLDFCLFL